MLRLPSAPLLAVMPVVWNTDWPASASAMVRVPASVRTGLAASSTTAPASSPAMTGASLVPMMVMVAVAVSVPPWPSEMV